MATGKSLFASIAGMFNPDVDETKTDAELHQESVEAVEALQTKVADLETENAELKANQPEDLSGKVETLEADLATATASLETANTLAADLQTKLNAEITARAGAEQKATDALAAKKTAEAIAAKAVLEAKTPPAPKTNAGDGKTLGDAIDKSVESAVYTRVSTEIKKV